LCHNDGTWCAKPKAEGGAEIKKRENLGEKGYKEIEVKKGLDHVEKKFRPRRKKA
jgi:hypothetical protein